LTVLQQDKEISHRFKTYHIVIDTTQGTVEDGFVGAWEIPAFAERICLMLNQEDTAGHSALLERIKGTSGSELSEGE